MSNWNDLSRDRLIKEYRKYPCLWSNKDEDVKNAEKRKECLTQITNDLNKYEEKPFTHDEVRTQFKNLRDMYRRKRKKLQLQHDLNISVDEPGWIYFQRLKFLDDSIDFGPPNESPLPPPKKKGKTAAPRSSDDASLPTPLEDNNASSHCQNPPDPDESLSNQSAPELRAKTQKRSSTPKSEVKKEREDGAERCESSSSTAAEAGDISVNLEGASVDCGKDCCSNPVVAEQKLSPRPAAPTAAEFVEVLSTHQKATHVKQQLGIRQEDEGEEFACFGRFVAMTLKKIGNRSPIDALEARKEISDVLYRTELNSLKK